MGVFGFEYAVRSKENSIAGLEIEGNFLIFSIGIQPERNAADADRLDNALPDENGIRAAGIGEREAASTCVVDGKDRRDETALEPRGVQAAVEHGEHFGGRAGMLDDVLAENADGERSEERRGGAFARDVTKGNGQTSFAIRKKVVEISAEFARRTVHGGKIETGDFTRTGGKQLALDFTCGRQIILETVLVPTGFFEQAGIFERDGDVGAERSKHALVLGREGICFGAFEVEHADEPVLKEQRHDELGASVEADVALDVARIFERVVDAENAAFGGGGSGEALLQRQFGA